MKPLLVVSLWLTAFNGIAQQDTVRKYLDQNLRLTQKHNAVYAAMAIRQGDHWMLFAVYPDTTVMLKMFFKDRALTVKDGPYTLFYPKNVRWQSGNFINNRANGLWQIWYRNKQLKQEGMLVNNEMQGLWKLYYENGQQKSLEQYILADSVKPVGVYKTVTDNVNPGVLDDFFASGILHGPASGWYASGQKESEVNFQHDTLSGLCTWFRENGQPSTRETYVNGKITALECYDESGAGTGSVCSILKPPLLIHPFFTALDYIEYELHKEKRKDIREEGEVNLSFVVTADGRVDKLRINNSPDSALSKHITRIFAAMPAWSPAIIHNRRLDYPVDMIIPYYRDFQ